MRIERLREEINQLQEQWDLLSETLRRLEREKILDTRVEEKLRLEDKIEGIQTERDKVEKQLCDLEARLPSRVGSLYSGAIIYGEVLRFFNKPTEVRNSIIKFLKEKIDKFIRPIAHTLDNPGYWVDFRGGDFTLFLVNIEEDVLTKLFLFGLYLKLEAFDFELSMTLSWERSAKYFKEETPPYFIARSFSNAKLFTSHSNDGQYLLAENVSNDLKGFLSGSFDRLLSSMYDKLAVPEQIKEKYQNYKENQYRCGSKEFVLQDRFKQPHKLINFYIESKRPNFKFTERFFIRLRKENIPGNIYDQLEKLKGNEYTTEKDILNALKKTEDDQTFQQYIALIVEHAKLAPEYLVTSKIPNDRIEIEHRDRREATNRYQAFMERLIAADEVDIIGVTNEGAAMFLEEALMCRKKNGKKFWEKLRIIFPNKYFIKRLSDHRDSKTRLQNWEDGKKKVFTLLLSKGKDHCNNWECRIYKGDLTFIANRFVCANHSNAGSRFECKNRYSCTQRECVRIAPIIPGADIRNAFFMEFFDPMPAYKQIINAFHNIHRNSYEITEWSVYGKIKKTKDEERFTYQGFVRRKFLHTEEEGCFPSIIVILHGRKDGRRRIFLQGRTKFNSAGEFGTFSNISGRAIDMDIYMAMSEEKRPIVNEENSDMNRDAFMDVFEKATGIKQGDPLPADTWRQAAVRELEEEIGLNVVPKRLTFQKIYRLHRDKTNLFFHIFSLELAPDELQQIENARPNANLRPFNIPELRNYQKAKKLNKLLQNKFEEIFMPIFKKFEIEGYNDR